MTMNKIYRYRGVITPESLGCIRAEISFSQHPVYAGVRNRKLFRPDEANKGLEALKRWISTGAFSAILIEGLSSALEAEGGRHAAEWISEHADEPSSPLLILVGDDDSYDFPFSAEVLDSADVLLNVLNT